MADSDKLPTEQTANSVPKSAEKMNEQDPNVGKDEGGVPAKQPILPTAAVPKAFQAVRVLKFSRSLKTSCLRGSFFNKSQVILGILIHDSQSVTSLWISAPGVYILGFRSRTPITCTRIHDRVPLAARKMILSH